MTRDDAIACMDALTGRGYSAALIAVAIPEGRRGMNEPDVIYRVEVLEMGVDGVDLRVLLNLADERGWDLGTHQLSRGIMVFTERRPEPPEAVAGRRKHPRA